jgi:TolA-binding protein
MAFLRRWLLILSVLIWGGGQLFAAPAREERAFAAAAAAFQDEVWARAETGFAQFVQRFPKSGRLAEAVLFQAQAQIKQGKFPEAIALLDARKENLGNLADRYYWTAEAQFAIGDPSHLAEAAETFVTLAKKFPESPLALSAVVEAGAAQEKVGNWAQLAELLGATNGVFQRAAALDAANELVSRGRLLLAQAKFTQQDFTGAEAVLKLLNPQTLAPKLEWQRDYLLGQVKSGAGDLEAALAVTTNLLSVARPLKNAGWLADSVVFHGALLEKMNRTNALAAWAENLSADMPAEKQKQAVLKVAELAAAQNDFTNAEVQLEKFLAQFADSPAAELALLTLGELHLKDFARSPAATNHLVSVQTNFDLVSAHTNFDRLIGGFTNSPLAGKAHLDRGWCEWFAEDMTNSLADFETAVKLLKLLPPSEDLAVARFKTGDAMFALTNYTGARENYNAVLTEFDAFPAVASSLGDHALYQVLRASLELKDAPGAEAAMQQLLAVFPKSELVDNSLLLVVQGSSPAEARAVFQKYQQQLSASALLPQVELAVARTYEREQNWPAAMTNYENWLREFPTNVLQPQVNYALAQANFQAGYETNAFQLFTNFIAQFPTDTNAPLAQWWVADHFFRLGGTNYPDAEKNYEYIFQTPAWKNSPLVYPAQLMAGRAAMGRQSFSDARTYLTKMLDTNCPPALATQARFAYGSVLKQLDSPDTNRPFLNFETATNVFAQIYAANPTNETGALACSELGDCNLQMGAFDAATNAYAQVVQSPYAGTGLRSRAQVGLGLTLEKKAARLPVAEQKPLLLLALKNYRDVFYSEDAAADFWMKKAGLQALPLMISLGDGDVDKFFDRLEKKLPPLTEMLEKKRAAFKK